MRVSVSAVFFLRLRKHQQEAHARLTDDPPVNRVFEVPGQNVAVGGVAESSGRSKLPETAGSVQSKRIDSYQNVKITLSAVTAPLIAALAALGPFRDKIRDIPPDVHARPRHLR
ncbi:hypothetical protein Landi51_03644 [Colletotrichum acutatum]